VSRQKRAGRGLPAEISVSKDEFIEATTDVWEIGAERATRVGHPAPFPVELPQRLIELYTYRDDLVLDPFMGSGTTGVAAVRTGRRFVGYDTETSYVEIAEQRIRIEQDRCMHKKDDADLLPRARREGEKARELARELLDRSGFVDLTADARAGNGIEVSFSGVDAKGRTWYFDVSGTFTSTRAGLRRADALWKALGKAAVLHAAHPDIPFVLITTDAPVAGSAGDQALATLRHTDRSGGLGPVFDVVEMESAPDRARLCTYAAKGHVATE
jgi:site-specific DNA-methyltransferase (adenine-specific)